jgi:hypothetical protein
MMYKFKWIMALLTVLTGMACASCSSKSDDRTQVAVPDSLKFDEAGYDSMRAHFSADSLFIAMLRDKIAKGDSNAARQINLFNMPYNRRHETGMNDFEIAVAIQMFRVRSNTLEKFNAIERDLTNTTAGSRAKADSIMKEIEKRASEASSH